MPNQKIASYELWDFLNSKWLVISTDTSVVTTYFETVEHYTVGEMLEIHVPKSGKHPFGILLNRTSETPWTGPLIIDIEDDGRIIVMFASVRIVISDAS